MKMQEWFYIQVQGYPVVVHFETGKYSDSIAHYEFFGATSDTGYRSHFFPQDTFEVYSVNYVEWAQHLAEEFFKESWLIKNPHRGDFSKAISECAKDADVMELLSINLLISNLL